MGVQCSFETLIGAKSSFFWRIQKLKKKHSEQNCSNFKVCSKKFFKQKLTFENWCFFGIEKGGGIKVFFLL